MKKIIIGLLFAVIVPLSAKAYYPYGGFRDVEVDVIACGGYNFMENVPLAGGAIGLQFWGVRAELETGWTCFNIPNQLTKKDFCYISPMVGYSYGFNHTVYAMIGITNWIYAENNYLYPDTNYNEFNFRKDMIYGKIKAGCNLFCTRNLFVNLDLSYLIPRKLEQSCITYQSFCLRAGIGFRF